jgi:hypothetical protein
MIAREVFEPLYRVKLFVISRCKPDKANKFIKKHFRYDAELDSKSYATVIQYEEGKQFILYFRKVDMQTIAHEASHILDDVYSYRGITHDCKCTACSEHRAHQQEPEGVYCSTCNLCSNTGFYMGQCCPACGGGT